jgi:putative flavoprotein involved in K+ transport
VSYAFKNKISVTENCQVFSVSKNENNFVLETNFGKVESKVVVNASGYFSSPVTPSFEGYESFKGPKLHFAQFKNAKQFGDQVKKILIVGKRLSAGQLLDELLKEKKELHISTRSPIGFTSPPFLFDLLLKFVVELEYLLILIKGPKVKLDVKMETGPGAEAIKKGEIKVKGQIEKIDGQKVSFTNKDEEKYDAIIFATGFRYTSDHLKNLRLEESGIPEGLFFIGKDNQLNFQSRFLRGIRRDGRTLSLVIKKYLNEK